jgi:hypothetical protein
LAQVHPFLKTQLTFKYQEDSHGIIVVFGWLLYVHVCGGGWLLYVWVWRNT